MRPNPLIPIFDMLTVVVVGLCGEETSVEGEKETEGEKTGSGVEMRKLWGGRKVGGRGGEGGWGRGGGPVICVIGKGNILVTN